jgi:protein-S-isoprenylcysteine O-methyltransferase Ste14
MKRILINLIAAAVVLLAGLLCLGLDRFWPFALPAVPEPIYWIFLLGGLGLIVLAEAAFLIRGGATGAPADPTRRLVTTGIYRWVRNPIYLGGALVLLGVAFARQSPTLLLVACLFLPVMHVAVVRREEDRMERGFGGEYLEYKRQVPRWIPRPPK